MNLHPDLPEELIEHLERYCEGRCPALAGHLMDELATLSRCAGSDIERCTIASLLRHWLGVDHSRIHQATPPTLCASRGMAQRWPLVSTDTVGSLQRGAVNES